MKVRTKFTRYHAQFSVWYCIARTEYRGCQQRIHILRTGKKKKNPCIPASLLLEYFHFNRVFFLYKMAPSVYTGSFDFYSISEWVVFPNCLTIMMKKNIYTVKKENHRNNNLKKVHLKKYVAFFFWPQRESHHISITTSLDPLKYCLMGTAGKSSET